MLLSVPAARVSDAGDVAASIPGSPDGQHGKTLQGEQGRCSQLFSVGAQTRAVAMAVSRSWVWSSSLGVCVGRWTDGSDRSALHLSCLSVSVSLCVSCLWCVASLTDDICLSAPPAG